MGRQVGRSAMSKWFRWWKDRTFLKILGIVIGAMVIALLLAVTMEYGWIGSIIVATTGGIAIRRIIIKSISKWNGEL